MLVVIIVAATAFVGAARVEAATNFTYTVNSTGDTNDTNLNDQACSAVCTLRSAIEQAKAAADGKNVSQQVTVQVH